jgi:hypothetical protein
MRDIIPFLFPCCKGSPGDPVSIVEIIPLELTCDYFIGTLLPSPLHSDDTMILFAANRR